ncbi:MAG TPA: HDOD domain-containing protein [Candidatus Aquilonibacter sp.]|nr:HDOD domain-containing protein [Candidatus Aquilonibacter sp.]
MESSATSESLAKISSNSATIEASAKRKNQVLAILAEGLPVLPTHIMQLNALLAASPVDLKKVSKIIRTDPGLTGQVLHLCNSALFGIRRRIFKVEEAAVLLGADRLRTLVFTCYLMDCSRKWLREREIQDHWWHSFMVGMMSERVARAINHPMPDQAYLSGLLHDVGKLPLLMVAAQDGTMASREVATQPGDNLEAEREYFGIDHCEVGRWVGNSWEFYPCHIDVFGTHHHPAEAKHDPLLVGIVSVADHFCEQQQLIASMGDEYDQDGPSVAESMERYIRQCLPMVGAGERTRVLQMLDSEYASILPVIQQTYGNVVSKKPDSGESALNADGDGRIKVRAGC